MYQVISCEKYMLDIIEQQKTDCKVLFVGSYTECEDYKTELLEQFDYVEGGWGNTKKETV